MRQWSVCKRLLDTLVVAGYISYDMKNPYVNMLSDHFLYDKNHMIRYWIEVHDDDSFELEVWSDAQSQWVK